MTRLCVCGHPRRAHGHYRPGGECALCEGCPRWRPRRWWWPWSHAARVIAETQAPAPPPEPSWAVPGHDPVPGPLPSPSRASGRAPAPAPGCDCGPAVAGIGFNRRGCMFTWDHLTGRWEHATCREPFSAAEWEARLRQS